MSTISKRRQQVHRELELTTDKEIHNMERAMAKEETRQERKWQRQMEIEESSSYSLIKNIVKYMDKWFLDPILGFFFPAGGDILGSVFALPFIYVSLFKVRSIPLTLAVIYHNLIDMLVGIIPFGIGDICDVFHRSNLKNFNLIKGFVEDDKAIIEEVNRKAVYMAIMIGLLCLLIYWLVGIVINITSAVWGWISGLFA